MSEEEIIARIKNLIDYIEFKPDRKYNTHFAIIAYPEEQWFQAIQGLLDLYNKEKEKNKLLIEGKFREVADKNSYIKDNYINKDKIKAKIEELEKQQKEEPDVYLCIKVLQSLLEKE